MLRQDDGGPRATDAVRRRVARVVTDVLAPAPVLLVLMLVVGWRAGRLAGVGWAVAAGAVAVGIPLTAVLLGVRTGRYTDVHVRVRRDRAVPVAMAVGSTTSTLFGLRAVAAPAQLVALIAAVAVGLALGGLITLWWKVSGHMAVAGAAIVVLTTLYGPALVGLLPVAALVGWSRVMLRDHTPSQTVVGLLVGVVPTLAVFVPLH